MSQNPYSILPYDVCNEVTLPAFPESQDCTGYDVLKSQICGLIIVPIGANKPTNWQTLAGWSGVIDNSDQSGTKGKYLSGIGSLLPSGKKQVELSNARRVLIADRAYRFDYTVLHFAPGHIEFVKMLEGGYRDFDAWFETIGGRIIGGKDGVRPFVPDAEHRYEGELVSIEQLRIVLEFFFPAVP